MKSLIAVLLSIPLFAADASQWSNLGSLNRGDHVGIVQMNHKRVEGRFVRSTGDAITVQADQEITVAKPDVVRVYRQSGMRRMTRVLIGAGAGIAAGAVLSATVGDRFRNEGSEPPSAAWIAGAAGVGAGVGALTGSGYHEIYRRP